MLSKGPFKPLISRTNLKRLSSASNSLSSFLFPSLNLLFINISNQY